MGVRSMRHPTSRVNTNKQSGRPLGFAKVKGKMKRKGRKNKQKVKKVHNHEQRSDTQPLRADRSEAAD